MNRTGLAYHPDCLKHEPYEGKPEVPGRVSETLGRLREEGLLDRLAGVEVAPARPEDLLRVHSEELVN